MRSGAKQNLLLPALLVSMLLVGACENDINKIKELSAKESEKPEQRTEKVDVMYSDSARVKMRLEAPLLIEYNDTAKNATPYQVTPKGVKITFYNADKTQAGVMVADSAIQYPTKKITKFYKNVVGTFSTGETLKTEELIWDQDKKIIYSKKYVIINFTDGGFKDGMNFMSDEKLTNFTFSESRGTFYTDETP
jgi:LPS export ABC transporter protein LptC